MIAAEQIPKLGNACVHQVLTTRNGDCATETTAAGPITELASVNEATRELAARYLALIPVTILVHALTLVTIAVMTTMNAVAGILIVSASGGTKYTSIVTHTTVTPMMAATVIHTRATPTTESIVVVGISTMDVGDIGKKRSLGVFV